MNFGIQLGDGEDEDDFYDEEKLSTDYIPEEMPHREEYQKMLFRNVFERIGRGKGAKHNYIVYGEPGTGKTMVVKSLITKVEEQSDPEALENFETIYLNCSAHSSYSSIFQAVANRIGAEWRNGIDKDTNKKEVLRKLNEYDKEVLLILDELDELKKKSGDSYIDDVFYTLTRPGEEAPVKQSEYGFAFNFICISNDPQISSYLENFNESVTSHSTKNIEFMGYKPKEITDILDARQDEAFEEKILGRNALEKISQEVFDLFGSDIRKALGILRLVPEKIEEQSHVPEDNIDQQDAVEEAMDEFKENYLEKVLQSGDQHFLLLMSALYTQLVEDKQKTKYIKESYWSGCEKCGIDKRSKSFVERSLETLVEQNLLRRRRDYKEPGNPYIYEVNFDLEIFRQKVKERMERYGYWKEIKEETTLSEEGKKAKKEAQEKLDELT